MRLGEHRVIDQVRRVALVGGVLTLAVAACTSTMAPPAVSATDQPASSTAATPTAPTSGDGCARAAVTTSSTATHRLTSSGNEYEYLLHVPASESEPAPLVLNFHGLGGDGPGQAAFTEYIQLADAEGFIVVHPSGLVVENPGAERLWGAVRNWEGILTDTSGRDDALFVSDLIDQVATQACIDQSRVYATGFSNGGYFSAHLVCELANRIAATFSVGGISFPDGCQPARPVAMGAVHGTADEIVPFDGSGESLLLADVKSFDKSDTSSPDIDPDKENEIATKLDDLFREVMPDELAKFATAFNCSGVAESEIGAVTSLTRHTDCDGGVEMRFYAVEGGGHTWPGTSWARFDPEYKAPTTDDVSATADGWAFMSQYSLDH